MSDARGQAESVNDQTDEADRTRSASLARLRHRLRTPLNALIGYTEMLLEDIDDSHTAHTSLYPTLQKVHSAANHLLALLNEALHPQEQEEDRASIGAAEQLRDRLRAPTEALIRDCEALRAGAQALGHTTLIPDIEKIRSASERFLSLIDEAGDDLWGVVEGAAEAGARAEGEHRPLREASDASEVLMRKEEAEGEEGEEGEEEGGPLEGGGVRTDGDPLLIVEDNEVNRDVLARHLGRQGYATAAAENGIRALEMVREGKFDLMLLDVMMPELDGYETLRVMKADPHLREIPVIMISALDDIHSVVRCIELGAEDYLLKPFDPVLLRARIGACLEKKRLRDLEVEYLRNVDRLTAAAAAVEAGEFDPEAIEQVAGRRDALGQLARVFQRMAREVHAREQRLKQEVRQLRIEIDERRTARQVAEITETDYFQDLQRKVDTLRLRSDDVKP